MYKCCRLKDHDELELLGVVSDKRIHLDVGLVRDVFVLLKKFVRVVEYEVDDEVGEEDDEVDAQTEHEDDDVMLNEQLDRGCGG